MALTYESSVDAILGTLKAYWDANSVTVAGVTALTGGPAPALVYESSEQDLKPHPKDGTKPWARAVVRHADASKVTLNNELGTARYRRTGLVWVQIFTPATAATLWTMGQRLAIVAQKAYEGKRAAGSEVLFTKAAIQERPKDDAWFNFVVKAGFYWDEVK